MKKPGTNGTIAHRDQIAFRISEILYASRTDQEVEAQLQQLRLESGWKRDRLVRYFFQAQAQEAHHAKLARVRDNQLRRIEGAAPPPWRVP